MNKILLATALLAAQIAACAEQSPVRVFIVAGQSNAEGHNHVRQYRDGREAFPESLRTQPNILFWPGSDAVQETENRWTALRVSERGSFGPEIGFARAMESQCPSATVAIVKYAAGGTGIARSADYTDYIPSLAGFNDNGKNWHPPTDGREAGALYRGLIANVRSALAALQREGKRAELAGVLWMQGEHEAGISRKMAEDYGRLLADFIRSVRGELHVPGLPFVIGQVNSHTWAFGDIARAQQAAVVAADEATALVETGDLPRNPGDAAHFTADGMLTLGERFAAAMAGLIGAAPARITLPSLLREMTDRAAAARWPEPLYESLQASSYNRASVHRDKPGWFADSDGTGFLRAEAGEWVIMEHDGPGCITKMWTPFFYYDFNNRQGPNLRIYLDGDSRPVLDEGFIALVTGKGSIPPPFAAYTARAGDSYLPIPFARHCKVTLTGKPFYFIINYRAYPAGTPVETFRGVPLAAVEAAGKTFQAEPELPAAKTIEQRLDVAAKQAQTIPLPGGPLAIAALAIRLDAPPAALRSTVLKLTCDGEQTVWCPVGDFFCCADSVHPFHTWQRTAASNGTMTCRWVMPYRQSAALEIENLGAAPVAGEVRLALAPWTWDERSMYFHAGWRPDELLPGTPFLDWNFIDIRGRGVFVGDAWTVLNPTQGWWGEGDEKIYVDGAWERGFPTHFGTGTEDYYGWAGGVNPTRADEFSAPFLANVRVGGEGGSHTRGYNISTRTRALDAIPFNDRLRFDMEASPGVDQRRPADFLGYSAAVFWYGRPGATHNRPPQPSAAGAPIMSLPDIERAVRAVQERKQP